MSTQQAPFADEGHDMRLKAPGEIQSQDITFQAQHVLMSFKHIYKQFHAACECKI